MERVVRMINRDSLDLWSRRPKVIFVLHHFSLICEGCLSDAKYQRRSARMTEMRGARRRWKSFLRIAWYALEIFPLLLPFLPSESALHSRGESRAEKIDSTEESLVVDRCFSAAEPFDNGSRKTFYENSENLAKSIQVCGALSKPTELNCGLLPPQSHQPQSQWQSQWKLNEVADGTLIKPQKTFRTQKKNYRATENLAFSGHLNNNVRELSVEFY